MVKRILLLTPARNVPVDAAHGHRHDDAGCSGPRAWRRGLASPGTGGAGPISPLPAGSGYPSEPAPPGARPIVEEASMRRFVLVSSVLAAVAVLLAEGVGRRRRRADPAGDAGPERVPRVRAASRTSGRSGARFRATALGRMLDDPEMKAFVAPIAEDLKKLAQDKQSKGGLPIPPMVLELARQARRARGPGRRSRSSTSAEEQAA